MAAFGLNVFLNTDAGIMRNLLQPAAASVESLGTPMTMLDITPLRRQETWEDRPKASPRARRTAGGGGTTNMTCIRPHQAPLHARCRKGRPADARRTAPRPRKMTKPQHREADHDIVQGFLLAVPDANKAAYTEMAEASAKVFRENVALSGDGGVGPTCTDGKVTSFPWRSNGGWGKRRLLPGSSGPTRQRPTAPWALR